ncbi:MAG: hypothetical protein GY798_00675 [Hyphomicrobiales bacterium]|nr:hypothetical protein [Hyphomicrobiales bacterium]
MTSLLLVGGGGWGRVVADLAGAVGYTDIAFVDDRWPDISHSGNWPVIGALGDVSRFVGEYGELSVCIGENRVRLALHREFKALGFGIPTVVHPSAFVSRSVQLGPGTIVNAQVVVEAVSVVGEAVILNAGCTIGHDSRLADAVHICPGANLGGQVHVGEQTWVGIGASVRQCTKIGRDVVIGAGAAVVSDIADGVIATGVPARARQSGGAAT